MKCGEVTQRKRKEERVMERREEEGGSYVNFCLMGVLNGSKLPLTFTIPWIS